MRLLPMILMLALGGLLQAQEKPARIPTSFYCFRYAEQLQDVYLRTGADTYQKVELSTANMIGPIGVVVGNGLVTIHRQQTDPLEGSINTWAGHRRLDDQQLDELAREIVAQVKQRGPFQSLAEFINRRLTDDELGLAGALQAAIDATAINGEATAGGDPLGAVNDAAHPNAAVGSTTDGAPAVINQGDLLTPLAPVLSARSDTFKIRAYGEAKRGTQTARAWCEAVVQRTPGFVDGSDEPETPVADLAPGTANALFGRRFKVVSFRWLPNEEV